MIEKRPCISCGTLVPEHSKPGDCPPTCELEKLWGCWQKEVPTESGYYWTATRDGLLAGLKWVQYDADLTKLYFAGASVSSGGTWLGWWWSIKVDEPSPPAQDAWSKS